MTTGIYNKNAKTVSMFDERGRKAVLFIDPETGHEILETVVLDKNQHKVLIEMFTSLPEEKRYNYTMKLQHRGQVVMKAYCYAHYDRNNNATGETIRFNYLDNANRFDVVVEYIVNDDVWVYINPQGEEIRVPNK